MSEKFLQRELFPGLEKHDVCFSCPHNKPYLYFDCTYSVSASYFRCPRCGRPFYCYSKEYDRMNTELLGQDWEY